MPRAIALPRGRYLQFIRYPAGPGKPRREIGAWTREYKKPYRYGRGSVVRLGRLGVQFGAWSAEHPDTLSMMRLEKERLARLDQDGLPLTEGVRLITEDEISGIRDYVRTGWVPALWHWRHWLPAARPLLYRLGFLTSPTVDAFANEHWRWPGWLPVKTVQQWWATREEQTSYRMGWETPGRNPNQVFDDDQVTEGWIEVEPVPQCGEACSEMHTFEPPCLWAREYG